MNPSPTPPAGGLPAQLEAALDADFATDFRDSVAPNTWRAYRADLGDFEHWCKSHRRRWSTPETVSAYFRALEDAGAAYATIERRKTAIAKIVEAENLATAEPLIEDPTKHPKVTVTLKAIRRRLGTAQEQATPLTGERLIQVLLAIDEHTLAGQRDIALLLIGFFGAMRRSELAAIRRHHLSFDNNGVGIELLRTKSSQEQSVWVPIHRQPNSRWDPVTALESWLHTIGLSSINDDETVWPRVTKGNTFTRSMQAISGDAINNITSRRVVAAGLANASTYSAHSLRAGFVTEAKNRGIDEADIMKHTRHKSLQQMRSYDRTSGWWNRNATANLAL